MPGFSPRYDVLPPPQRDLCPELGQIPKHFVLYGGTAIALRLGHRVSLDFDFFTSESFKPDNLLAEVPLLAGAEIVQNVSQTLTVVLKRNGRVKLSFFGGLHFGRVGEPEQTEDGSIWVASLLDLAGMKAAVITQRAESKDYLDMLALIEQGITLAEAMGAARAIYGQQYNPLMTLKSLTYFNDGDLNTLTGGQKTKLTNVAIRQALDLPTIPKLSDSLSV